MAARSIRGTQQMKAKKTYSLAEIEEAPLLSPKVIAAAQRLAEKRPGIRFVFDEGILVGLVRDGAPIE
jgi:hypothetical protein